MKSRSNKVAVKAASRGLSDSVAMTQPKENVGPSWQAHWLLFTLFCGVTLLLVHRVNPELRLHVSAATFFVDSFPASAYQPGGSLQYAAAFLAELDRFPWLSALVTTLEAGALFWLTSGLLGGVAGQRVLLAPWIPLCLWLQLLSFYAVPLHQITLGLIAAAGSGVLCLRLLRTHPAVGVGITSAIVLLLLGFCGIIPALLSSLLIGISGMTPRTSLRSVVSWIPALLLAVFAFPLSLQLGREFQAWQHGPPFLICLLLHAFYPVAATSLALDLGRGISDRLAWFPLSFGLILVAGLVAFFSVDLKQRAAIQVIDLAEAGRWKELLDVARGIPSPTPATRLEINRALFHTGRLSSEFFSFERVEGEQMLPDLKSGSEVTIALSQTLLELGQVNVAEHYALEGLELFGPRPATLKLLVRIYLLKGQPDPARVFLGRLGKNPFDSAWAERYLAAIEAGAGLACDPALVRVANFIPRQDEPYSTVETGPMLAQLVETNPTNQMAFEFLMTHYLLTKDLGRLAAQAQNLRKLGYKTVPVNYEQALLLYEQKNPALAKVQLERLSISAVTRERFETIKSIIREAGGEPENVRSKLAADFGDTFWCYYLFGECPGSVRTPRGGQIN